MPHAIPVILITGFLGSGKTSLLNRLLADDLKTAVIINEFGATPIDQDLLQQQNIPLTVLSGGCLCCQIKGALAPTLKNLWMAWNSAAEKPFERIIIETSGIASPEPILDTLLRERWLASRYRLEAVITTLAIPSALAQLETFIEARAQVTWADTLLLTHADLASADQLAALEQQLQVLAPATPRHTATLTEHQAETLLTNTSPLFRRLPSGNQPAAHGFASVSLHLDQALPWPKLQAMLQELMVRHPTDLLRIKGVIYQPEQTEALAIQAAANRLYPPTALANRSNDDRRGRLIFITVGDSEKLAEDLQQIFEGVVAANAIRQH